MDLALVFFWLLWSVLVGWLGSSREIGFWPAFLLSLVLSPLIGLIIALLAKDNETQKYKKELLAAQQKQVELLAHLLERHGGPVQGMKTATDVAPAPAPVDEVERAPARKVVVDFHR